MVATIHDVALEAGVGIGTVSRVINNSPRVKHATRERVLAAIDKLHYKPDPIARSMVSKRTNSLGVIVPFFTQPFFTEVLRGVEAVSARLGRELVLYNVETDAQRDHYFSELPMLRKVDGLLIVSLTPDHSVSCRLKDSGLPVVLIANLLFEPELMLTSEWSRMGGKQAALQLLSQQKRPTAIFAASDMQAVGVLEAAKNLGIPVPEQLSVMGFDGIEVSELLELSTIQQPMQEMGEVAAAALVELIDNSAQTPELIRFDTKLVERRTTGPAPSNTWTTHAQTPQEMEASRLSTPSSP